MSAGPRFASYDDILALPEHVTGEIIDGELHTQPRPTSRHARVELGIGRALFGSFDLGDGGPGGWVILSEPELHLGPHVLVPDLAGWRRERLPLIPDGPIEVASDWVCEILSPGTARKDRARKLPLYGRLGVAHAWLVWIRRRRPSRYCDTPTATGCCWTRSARTIRCERSLSTR